MIIPYGDVEGLTFDISYYVQSRYPADIVVKRQTNRHLGVCDAEKLARQCDDGSAGTMPDFHSVVKAF